MTNILKPVGRIVERKTYQQLLSRFSSLFQHDADEGELPDDGDSGAEALVVDAIEQKASDIHIDPHANGATVRFRIEGALLDVIQLEKELASAVVNQLKTMADINPGPTIAPEEGRIQRHIDDYDVDIRLAVVHCAFGEKISLRLLNRDRVHGTLDSLGLYDEHFKHFEHWLYNVDGLFVVAGPTGSGKTTTLYAMLDSLKQEERSIVTLEDPIEYAIEGVNQIEMNPRHHLDYATGLKTVMRMDPDYILVGEVRDQSSAQSSMTAAASGHALMTTLHSRDAVGVVEMLRHYGVDNHEIAANLAMVVAQRLVRKLCPHCRKQGKAPDVARRWLSSMGIEEPDGSWIATGCDECNGLGYDGRTGIFEVWRLTDEDKQIILGGGVRSDLVKRMRAREHRFLIDSALQKVCDGETSLDEIRRMGGVGMANWDIEIDRRKKPRN